MIEIGILIMFLSLYLMFSSNGTTHLYDKRFKRMVEER